MTTTSHPSSHGSHPTSSPLTPSHHTANSPPPPSTSFNGRSSPSKPSGQDTSTGTPASPSSTAYATASPSESIPLSLPPPLSAGVAITRTPTKIPRILTPSRHLKSSNPSRRKSSSAGRLVPSPPLLSPIFKSLLLGPFPRKDQQNCALFTTSPSLGTGEISA